MHVIRCDVTRTNLVCQMVSTIDRCFFQGRGGRNEVSGAEFLQHIREARDSECKAPCAKKGWGRPEESFRMGPKIIILKWSILIGSLRGGDCVQIATRTVPSSPYKESRNVILARGPMSAYRHILAFPIFMWLFFVLNVYTVYIYIYVYIYC